MSIERNDDDVPTTVDVDLSDSSSAEITLEVPARATGTGRETLPADSEPTTLEPQMAVRGLAEPGQAGAPGHPADLEGPTKSVEARLLKAYAAEVQAVEERRAARHGGKPRAPSLPTTITPSEPFRSTSPGVAGVGAGRPAAVEEADEETVTDARLALGADGLLAAIEGQDATTAVSDATPMLSSNDLITDPGITDPGIAAPGVVVLAVAEDDDERYGSNGTVKIVVTPPAMPVPASVSILMPTPAAATAPRPLPAPTETARPARARDRRGASRRAAAVVVTVALVIFAATLLYATIGPPSSRSREGTAESAAASPPAPVASASSAPPAPSASPEATEGAAAPASAPEREPQPPPSAVVKAHGPSAPRIPRPPPRLPGRPLAPPSSAQKPSTPLHI